MTKHYENKLFGTIQAQHLATFEELCQYKHRGLLNIVEKRNRHKYWFCQCTACKTIHIVRSDYLSRKKCRCQKLHKR